MPRSYVPTRFVKTEGEPYYEDEAFGEVMPALYQLLCASQADGRPRLGASLSLFAEHGRLKACIYDKSTSMVWFCTLDGSRGILEQVETALEKGAGEWRPKRAR
jgi:hypothetical protein